MQRLTKTIRKLKNARGSDLPKIKHVNNQLACRFSSADSNQKITKFKQTEATNTQIADIPTLKDFLNQQNPQETGASERVLGHLEIDPRDVLSGLKYHIQTYGCQMNVSDSEIVASILESSGMESSSSAEEADLVMLNTCAIRENAEEKVWSRLDMISSMMRKKGGDSGKVVGVLGCMAERLKERMVDKKKVIDLVVGPDAYRDLPHLVSSILVKFI